MSDEIAEVRAHPHTAIDTIETALAERDREIGKWKWMVTNLAADSYTVNEYGQTPEELIAGLERQYDAAHPAKDCPQKEET